MVAAVMCALVASRRVAVLSSSCLDADAIQRAIVTFGYV